MNRTVSVNISGMIFHIEETGYDILKNYLNTIRGYFKNTQGGDEIMVDVESRIAEMFQDRIKNRQVIELSDVEHVIEVMGKPEAFMEDQPPVTSTGPTSSIPQDPDADLRPKNRRIYRDPDDRIIGGVCSGISYYLNIDPIWLRLILGILFFGFGTGFIIYILLWIIIPKAKTTAEKLEMRGEPINLTNIEKSIREELEGVKDRFKEMTDETRPLRKKATSEVGIFFERMAALIVELLKSMGGILKKMIGVALVIFGLIMFFLLAGIHFTDMNMSVDEHMVSSLSLNEIRAGFFNSAAQFQQAWISIWLVIGIPALAMLYSGICMIFDIRKSYRAVNIAMSILWIIGLFIAFLVAIDITKEFNAESEQVTKTVVPSNASTFTIKTENPTGKEREAFSIETDKGEVKLTDLVLTIEKTDADSLIVEVIKSSRGRSDKSASTRVADIRYNYNIQDSSLVFDEYFMYTLNEKYRGQEVDILVKVPVGKSVYLDKSAGGIIYDIKNVGNIIDSDMLNKTWKMTDKGLECLDCTGSERTVGDGPDHYEDWD